MSTPERGRGFPPMRPIAITLWILAAGFAALPTLAASGVVLDPEGRPVAGARACLWRETNVGLCVETDPSGNYGFPPTTMPSVRITAQGFLPEMVAAVPQSSPVVLRRAASLRVAVVDAESGAPVETGTVTLTYLSGRTLEGFPFNRAGVRIATLEPGSLVVRAESDGYEEMRSEPVPLPAGKETEMTLRLNRRR